MSGLRVRRARTGLPRKSTCKTASPFRVSLQFDFAFVEVYRVRKFQFVSKHVEDEDSDLKERGKTRFGQICSDHPPCCCSVSNSSWNCDGEVLSSSAIEVR